MEAAELGKTQPEGLAEEETAALNADSGTENADVEQYSDVEKKAMELGWKPKEQFKGGKFRDAEDFLERGEFLNTIRELKYSVRSYHQAMQDLLFDKNKQSLQETEQKIQQLRDEAIENGDVDSVRKLDQELAKAKQKLDEEARKRQASQDPLKDPDVHIFVERNKEWFNNDDFENSEMRTKAIEIATWFNQRYPEKTVPDQLEYVEKSIRKLYPHRFGANSASTRTPAVIADKGRSTNSAGAKGYRESDINPALKKVARDFVRDGIFKSEEEYYKAYFQRKKDLTNDR